MCFELNLRCATPKVAPLSVPDLLLSFPGGIRIDVMQIDDVFLRTVLFTP